MAWVKTWGLGSMWGYGELVSETASRSKKLGQFSKSDWRRRKEICTVREEYVPA
jgi:hypothetical protein